MKTNPVENVRHLIPRALPAAILALHLALISTLAAPGPADASLKGAGKLMAFPPPERLPSETNNPVLRPLAEKWKLLSIELLRFSTVRSNHTVNLAMHVIRKVPGKPVLVFIHGLLADYLMWEYVTAALADDYEIWLVDLPGCGDSDAPKPASLEPDGFSPTAMGDRVWQVLRQRFAAEGGAPRQITLVGHSLGGTVVIRMLSAPELQGRYTSEEQRVDRAVVFAPCDLAINAVPPSFLKLLGLKGWMISVGNVLGVFDGKVRELTRRNFQDPEFATDLRQERYAHALRHTGHREAAKAILRQFAPFDPKTLRPMWPEIERLVAGYKNIHVPVLIVYGTCDETLYAGMGNKLRDEIPGAVLVKVPRRGHSLPTEDPWVCANLIRCFQRAAPIEELEAGSVLMMYQGPMGTSLTHQAVDAADANSAGN